MNSIGYIQSSVEFIVQYRICNLTTNYRAQTLNIYLYKIHNSITCLGQRIKRGLNSHRFR